MHLKRKSSDNVYNKIIENKNEIFKNYYTALEYFWLGCKSIAIEHLTKILADIPDNFLSFNFYRLWIEILLDQKDYSALRSLNIHLKLRSHIDTTFAPTYLALSGLIHYELDEFKAANLIAKGVSKHKKDPYCQELVYLVKQRINANKVKCDLLYNFQHLNDYYHFNTLLKYLISNSKLSNYNRLISNILNRVDKLFPNSPLPLLYKLHMSYMNHNYSKSKIYAKQLFDLFPSQIDNAVYLAFVAIKDNDLDLAKSSLEKAQNMGGDDIDVNLLLGISYALMFQKSADDELKNKAIKLLSKAEKYLESRGMSSIIPNYYKNLLSFKDNMDEVKGYRIPKVWLHKLNPSEFHTIRTDKISNILFVYKYINKEVKVGDICLFVGEDYQSNFNDDPNLSSFKSFRLLAAYFVASDVKNDYLYGPYNLLKFITRPSFSIPIKIPSMQNIKLKKIFTMELNSDALEVIINNIKEFYRTYSLDNNTLIDVIQRSQAS